jgi:hypothetical protein
MGAEVCRRCLTRRPAFDRVVATLAYAFPADALDAEPYPIW